MADADAKSEEKRYSAEMYPELSSGSDYGLNSNRDIRHAAQRKPLKDFLMDYHAEQVDYRKIMEQFQSQYIHRALTYYPPKYNNNDNDNNNDSFPTQIPMQIPIPQPPPYRFHALPMKEMMHAVSFDDYFITAPDAVAHALQARLYAELTDSTFVDKQFATTMFESYCQQSLVKYIETYNYAVCVKHIKTYNCVVCSFLLI